MIIYVITNIINGKKYVGQTVQPLSIRWSQHKNDALNKNSKNVFHKAIRKYGIENFTIELVETASSAEELNAKELELIKIIGSHYIDGNGYNMCNGGDSRSGWKEDSLKTEKRIAKIKKQIICIETQEIFPSVKDAAKHFGTTPSHLGNVLKGRKTSIGGNFHFRYLNESENENPDQLRIEKQEKIEKLYSFGKPIVCLTDGRTFKSIKEAAREIGVAEINFRKALKKESKTCKGLIFEYKDQLIKENP